LSNGQADAREFPQSFLLRDDDGACGRGQANQKSKISNQKFPIKNPKTQAPNFKPALPAGGQIPISKTKNTQNYIVHLYYPVIPTTVGRKPALPAGGNPLL
jgi:hypothetical protein